MFAWTKAPRASVKERQETCRKQSYTSQQLHNHNVLESIENISGQQQPLLNEEHLQLVPENVTSDENTMANNDNDIPMSSCDTGTACVNIATSTNPVYQSVDATTSTYPVYQSDASIQNVVLTMDSDTDSNK